MTITKKAPLHDQLMAGFDAALNRARLYALLCLQEGNEAAADRWIEKAAQLQRLMPSEVVQ